MTQNKGVQYCNEPVTESFPCFLFLNINNVAAEKLIPIQSRNMLKLNTSSTPFPKKVIKAVVIANTVNPGTNASVFLLFLHFHAESIKQTACLIFAIF